MLEKLAVFIALAVAVGCDSSRLNPTPETAASASAAPGAAQPAAPTTVAPAAAAQPAGAQPAAGQCCGAPGCRTPSGGCGCGRGANGKMNCGG